MRAEQKKQEERRKESLIVSHRLLLEKRQTKGKKGAQCAALWRTARVVRDDLLRTRSEVPVQQFT